MALTFTGYWTCLSLIFLTCSMRAIPPPTTEVVNEILKIWDKQGSGLTSSLPVLYWSPCSPVQLTQPHPLLPSFASIPSVSTMCWSS